MTGHERREEHSATSSRTQESSSSTTASDESTFIQRINTQLLPSIKTSLPTVVDLFAGCGGLSLGFEAQGFPTIGFEKDESCCNTYQQNLVGDCIQGILSPESNLPECDVLIGGPPCQPFSVGGKQLGLEDSRDGFPIFLSAVQRLQPSLLLFENVRGLFYRNKWYLEQVIEALEGMGYLVETELMNAKYYGVPQNRERVIVVGHRGHFEFPKRTNSLVTAGEALGELAFEVPDGSRFLTASMDTYVAKYEKASKCINPRDLHLEKPARTLTCRNLAGATGDMHRIKLPDGRRKRLSIREAARLQSFPDWFTFHGREQAKFYQIGNAVAPLFGYALAGSCRDYFDRGGATRSTAEVEELNQERQRIANQGQLSLFGGPDDS